MASLMRCLLLSSLHLVVLSLATLQSSGLSTLPPPPPTVKFSIAVEGIVFCRTCRLKGYNESFDASPLPGAIALFRCRDGKRTTSVQAKTDTNGYFLIQTERLTSFTSDDCRVFVAKSPVPTCDVRVYPGGKDGSAIKFERVLNLSNGLQALYSAGVFVFGPGDPSKCY